MGLRKIVHTVLRKLTPPANRAPIAEDDYSPPNGAPRPRPLMDGREEHQ
jgi:hypothetical protein